MWHRIASEAERAALVYLIVLSGHEVNNLVAAELVKLAASLRP